MKPIKMLILTTVASIAATAFLGAGMASAAGVHSCAGSEETVSPCGPGLAPFTGERTYHILGPFVFASTFTTVECASGEATGKITSSGTKTENAKGKIEKISWSKCSSTCGAATVAPINLPWSFEAIDAKTEVIKGVAAEYTTCGQTCKYEATEMKVNVAGGEKATATLSEVPLKKIGGGALCSATATWTAVADLLPQHFAYTVLI